MKLLYFSPATTGGLADYAREQANALARLGVEVTLLSSADFPTQSSDLFRLKPGLIRAHRPASRLAGRWAFARKLLSDHGRLAQVIETENCRHILHGSFAEYLAPLWSGRLKRLAQRGVVFGAVVHDPIRDHVVGPRAWHRYSVACAYSFLREAFVHEPMTLDTVRPVTGLSTTVIPHGPYPFPSTTATREEARRKMGLPESADVWLSFGHIRDGKNLDLAIRSLARFPEAFLLVAGKEQSSGQKPVSFYAELAQQCGVTERCRWLNRFIAPEEVGDLFVASDVVLLTYSRKFHSASGVLNAAVNFRKPCLASSGPGNLQTVVARYGLGTWIEPDSEEALMDGLRRRQSTPPAPQWDAYLRNNSWEQNARIVMQRMFNAAT